MTLFKLVPSLLVAALTLGVTTTAGAKPAAAKQKPVDSRIVVDKVALQGVGVANNVLTATGGTVTGTIAGLPFTTDITNFAVELAPAGDGVCSILNLELAPIDIDLLGLHVDTSAICLTLTAMEGGGLLGDLLCGLAGDLNLLDDVLAALPGVLNESLAKANPPQGEPADICDGECEVLDLAIGPVDLNLLGLEVYLDNCEDGPVQVCVSASQGEGLLGNLLCGLTGGGLLPDLGNLGDILDGLGLNLTDKQLGQLTKQVGKLLRDGNLSLHDIEKLIGLVQKLA